MFAFETDKAKAATWFFETEDGTVDNYVDTSSSWQNVFVIVPDEGLIRTDGYGAAPAAPSQLKVRLCNTAYPYACTSFKTFTTDRNADGIAKFYDMKVGTYYVDIRDNYIGQWVEVKNNTFNTNSY
ncbi:hypothetical protein [Peribacillus simplex]|uniref:hypothetical protein n=1 Tax=Peribacillus simplex TaxID=1478 RepID=UPI0024C142EE|nr:hypothetical protein [Peribacillus simplex]WHY99340.1 hypothetical protein QNH37_09380 [Peribacillus simplex]